MYTTLFCSCEFIILKNLNGIEQKLWRIFGIYQGRAAKLRLTLTTHIFRNF